MQVLLENEVTGDTVDVNLEMEKPRKIIPTACLGGARSVFPQTSQKHVVRVI